MTLPQMPDNSSSRESLRIAGGYQAPALGASPAGGLDIDPAGNLATSGALTVDGILAAGDPPQSLTNAAGELDGARLQSASVAPAHLDPSASYALGALAVGGVLRLVRGTHLNLNATETITPTHSFHYIDTDIDERELETIVGGVDGNLLVLVAEATTNSFIVRYSDNITGPGSGIQVEHRDIFVLLMCWSGTWHVIAHNGVQL